MASVTQLRAFHYVATAGGYSQAARETAISQSNLSGQVRQLEAASGLALFERGPYGVRLTSDGEALFKVTARLFLSLGEADAILKSRKVDGGRLRIASDGVVHSLPILAALRRYRPNLVFSLLVHNSDAVIEQVAQYRADVGVTAQKPKDDRFHVRPLTSMNIGVFIPKSHPWARRRDVAIRELEGLPFVLREKGSRTRELFEQNIRDHGVSLGPILEVSTREGVRETVAAGFGFGAVADLEFGFDTRLHFLPLRDVEVMIDEYLVCLDERRRIPMIEDFLKCAAEALGSRSPLRAALPEPA
ncbi:LysR family transcriptional regulator [Bosea sp. BH3]|uniref:LysR family transcriptional regulator n=1 Tax=Bosea sp. BH3 TaxID=2871701 RepID=UPI0021CB71D7|nr:LysR family transcriptional regulator [Bosea sp. BH3]MCU4181101.1 LysR family transcriptional regulator [Bosea sp. BH3]